MKSNRVIKFKMSSLFDFKNIRNFIYIKFISSTYKAMMRMFSSFESTINITSKLKQNIKIFTSLKNNTVWFMKNKTMSALCSFLSSVKKNTFSLKDEENCSASLILYGCIMQEKIWMNVNAIERYVLYSATKDSIRLTASNFANMLLFLTSSQLKLSLKSNAFPKFELFATNKETGSSIVITQFLDADIELYTKIYKNKIGMKASGSANAYMPFMLKHLYPQKIKDWYDITIEDVFYGINIV